MAAAAATQSSSDGGDPNLHLPTKPSRKRFCAMPIPQSSGGKKELETNLALAVYSKCLQIAYGGIPVSARRCFTLLMRLHPPNSCRSDNSAKLSQCHQQQQAERRSKCTPFCTRRILHGQPFFYVYKHTHSIRKFEWSGSVCVLYSVGVGSRPENLFCPAVCKSSGRSVAHEELDGVTSRFLATDVAAASSSSSKVPRASLLSVPYVRVRVLGRIPPRLFRPTTTTYERWILLNPLGTSAHHK